mmetsp:Transcript_10591/g.44141  ORF Transcript_10591/g.44141 Transcript_10591/m.44141 type:complete len:101 (-) Transcript_10591:1564-1866(-)
MESESSEASIIKSSVLPIPVPFPHRFSAAVGRDGNFLDNAESALRMKAKGNDFECESCGVLSVLSADAKGGCKVSLPPQALLFIETSHGQNRFQRTIAST